MIAPLPVRISAWLTPAVAILIAAAIYGQWSATPTRTASAHALDAAAWHMIGGVMHRLVHTKEPRRAGVGS